MRVGRCCRAGLAIFFLLHTMVSFPRRPPSFVPLHGRVVLPRVLVPACSCPIPKGGLDNGRALLLAAGGRLWAAPSLSTGEAAWGSAKTRAGVGTRSRKPESQGPALIPSGAALCLATWGPRDIEASGLSGPTPPPFPEKVICVPKVKEWVSVASSLLLPFCTLRDPQSPASFPPPNRHSKPEGNPKLHVHRRSLSQQEEGGGSPELHLHQGRAFALNG